MAFFLSELIGTAVLIIFGGGVVANVVLEHSKGQGGGWIVVATGWGLGVAIAVYVAAPVSGAHINPAVTLGLAVSGQFAWSLVPLYMAAQFLGAIVGAAIVWLAYRPHWRVTEDADAKLVVFCTAPAIRDNVANLTTEIIGTGMLVFGALAIGFYPGPGETGLGPFLVGVLVWALGLSLGGPTGYAINPARDLGPRIAHALLPIPGKRDADWRYAWIPVVGPFIGGALGGAIWLLRVA